MKHKSRAYNCRRVACIALTALFGATFLAGQMTAFASPASAVTDSGVSSYSLNYSNANGTVNLTDIKLGNLSNQVMSGFDETYADTVKSVIVTLDGQPVCNGGSESAIKSEQKSFLKELTASGISYEYKSSYSTVLNAVAIDVSLSDLRAIKAMGGVSTVSVSSTYARPETDENGGSSAQLNYSNIYKNGIYNSSKYVDEGIDGTGMTVAILDTGLDYTHEAFLEETLNNQSAVSFDKGYIESVMDDGTFKATTRSGATADDVYINAKVPFAYDYADNDADVYPSYSQHGTHVAGIVAGKADSYTDKDGNVAKDDDGNVLSFRGVAPEAQLVICKVFTDDLDNPDLGGAITVDILDALEDCTKLNVDIINMSLGTTAGFSSASLGLTAEDDEGILMNTVYSNVRSAGITLMVAASNDFSAGYGSVFGTNLASNPDSGTVGSPSTYDGAMSVASINGQYAPYILANATVSNGTVSGGSAIYYEESRNEDSDAYNFINDLLGGDDPNASGYLQSATFKYVVIPGTGSTGDYTSTVRRELNNKQDGEKIIAVIKRGSNTFKDKIQIAYERGADAVIVYNNVSGMVRMSLGDLQTHIPAISVSMDAGAVLTGSGSSKRLTGTVTLDRSYLAGPFMNDYSSWGTTADLKLKPDVTSHGGEITSTVAGGYDEMSGTSMACPNLAGFTALLKSYLKNNYEPLWKTSSDNTQNAINLTNLTNAVMMSTATTVYDQNNLPYSPRKQGSGLATLDNVMSTSAYLYTVESDGYRKDNTSLSMYDDGRPKAELGEDKDKAGVYNITFYVKNFGTAPLTFKTNTIFMTETLGADGLSVAEKAHVFDSKGVWTVNGTSVAEGATFLVPANSTYKVQVKLTLTAEEKAYLDTNFENGMFVEGYLQLLSETDSQCDLTFPFMGFYGDWRSAPLLDYDCFEVASFDRNTSYNDDDRPKARIWATQAYSYYWNEKYATPLGSFLYLQDPDKEHTSEYVYTDADHIAISCFNDYYGAVDNNNYLTITGIRALYAGLLRNAELATYTLTNEYTGEVIPDENGNLVREIYRLRKAYAGGGSAVPAQVLLEMRTDELGLDGSGKYRMDFQFYFDYDDYAEGKGTDNTFTMSFYVDYEAPILQDSRLRFQDKKDSSGKDIQEVYLDLDIYDNHYPQAVILCYSETGIEGDIEALKLATEYITPVLNPKKNDTTTVSINITDIYADYRGKLYVELDDYAMNHNVYQIEMDYSQTSVCPSGWSVPSSITLDKNTTVKVDVQNLGSANVSNLQWATYDDSVVKVKNGELFGVSAGTAIVVVSAGGESQLIEVTVKDSNVSLKTPSVSFGTILNSEDMPVKAQGMVKVNPAQQFKLELNVEPWYYPIENLTFNWTSGDDTLATVDSDGNVTVLFEDPDEIKTVTISARCVEYPSCYATVTLVIQEPYTVSNNTLTRYRGWGGELCDGVIIGGEVRNGVRVLTIPTDKAIMSIGEEAFAEVEGVEVVVIPKNVTSIAERAFKDCINLKKICFITETEKEAGVPSDSSLNMIYRYAFTGCTSLTTIDLSNCKVITLDREVFANCTSLKNVINMQAIGTAHAQSFAGCTALEEVDISALHVAGVQLFAGCTSLTSVITSANTAMSQNMFNGCTALENVEINCDYVPANAFKGCTALETVSLTAKDVYIGGSAFTDCINLANVSVPNGASYVGNYAFRNCSNIQNLATLQQQLASAQMGINVFSSVGGVGEVIKDGKLVTSARSITSLNYLTDIVANGVTSIGAYAFSGSVLSGIDTLDLTGITEIGEGAFYGLSGLKVVTIPQNITKIADYAFANTGLTSITIPASVTEIGSSAFANCTSLVNITFANGNQLATIGNSAFSGVAITSLDLPATVENIGSYAFENNTSLRSVNLPAVKTMGEGVFMNCTQLATAVFGDDAETTGIYTFISYNRTTKTSTSSLTSVTLGAKIEEIGTGAFGYCEFLTNVNLNNATVIGDEAFYGCKNLATVTGIEKVTAIGNYAFLDCQALRTLDLSSAEKITYRSFAGCSSLTSVTFGNKLEGIGDDAFAGTKLTSVTIPQNCEYVGVSAFSVTDSRGFSAYQVAEGNKNYFAEDGVLYRYIDKENGVYELISYPYNKTAKSNNVTGTYAVKEGTVAIEKYAFFGVPSSKVDTVILPYTLKTIGTGAFYGSGISSYTFESINAPVLLEDFVGRTIENDYSMNSYFYMNFGDYLVNYVPNKPGDTVTAVSTFKISYPSNGKGYTNFIYSKYFGAKTVLEEMPEDDTRTLKSALEGFVSADAVSATYTTKAEVEEFAEQVKNAHMLYNGLKTDYQLSYVGEENVAKLFAIESALKPLKAQFGIEVSVSGVAVSSDSTHKKSYVVGEKFSLNGLKVLVTYDDYSQETIDAVGNFVLASNYDRELRATDKLVNIVGTGVYDGMTISVRGLTVSEASAESNEGSSINLTGIIIGVVCGVVGLAVVAVVVVIILKKKKGVAHLDEKSAETAEEVKAEQAETQTAEEETKAQASENQGDDKTND
ncbi:MAG: leucine-rich repeat protein [Candidatus Coproplasma sp.]